MEELIEYLLTVAKDRPLSALYTHPSNSCLVVRCLDDTARSIVTRILYVNTAVTVHAMKQWVKPSSHGVIESSLSQMSNLHIVSIDAEGGVLLCPEFRQSLQCAFRLGHLAASDVQDVRQSGGEVDKKSLKSVDQLQTYALERWESVLQYLAVCNEQSHRAVAADTKVSVDDGVLKGEEELQAVLLSAGFIGTYENNITSTGFHFLLMQRRRQIWTYLMAHLKHSIGKGADLVTLFTVLSQLLVSRSVLVPYAKTSSILEDQHAAAFIHHLREVGLVFMRKRKDAFFHITPFARSLCDGREVSSAGGGFVIVETNFRVYAYTNSTLQLSILSTFVDVSVRFENMCVGVLTRESVRKAFQFGIKAPQIISFLTEHSYLGDAVPTTVADQIHLWEMERHRFTFAPSVTYSQFDSEVDYRQLLKFVTKDGTLLWNDEEGRVIVVNADAHEAVKTFWKRIRQGEQKPPNAHNGR